MSIQPGWYPDPERPRPGEPPRLRYWSGEVWTEHTAAAPLAAPSGRLLPMERQRTPDGVPLATWWQRVGAYVIDGLLIGLVQLVVGFPWIRQIWDVYVDYFDQVMRDAEAGRQSSASQFSVYGDIAVPLLVLTVIGLVINFAYYCGMLAWRQATLGKLALGLRVRRREAPGPMPFGTIVLRWAAHYGIYGLSAVPAVGTAISLYSILDSLWPLWDGRRQALHDKVAGTSVVRVR